MATYKTSLDINAPAGRVWQILTSFDRYREWNPQIPRAAGKAEEGTQITLRLALPGSNAGGSRDDDAVHGKSRNSHTTTSPAAPAAEFRAGG